MAWPRPRPHRRRAGARSAASGDCKTSGADVTCAGDGSAAPRCVMFAGVTPEHVSEVMCTKRELGRPVVAPAWAPDMLAALARVPADQTWQLTPIQDAPAPAVALQIDDA